MNYKMNVTWYGNEYNGIVELKMHCDTAVDQEFMSLPPLRPLTFAVTQNAYSR